MRRAVVTSAKAPEKMCSSRIEWVLWGVGGGGKGGWIDM